VCIENNVDGSSSSLAALRCSNNLLGRQILLKATQQFRLWLCSITASPIIMILIVFLHEIHFDPQFESHQTRQLETIRNQSPASPAERKSNFLLSRRSVALA